MKYRYGLTNRPAMYGAIPNLPHEVDADYRNERMNIRHGIVSYAAELTPDQVRSYELVDMQKPACGLCRHFKSHGSGRYFCSYPLPPWVLQANDDHSLFVSDYSDPRTDGDACKVFAMTDYDQLSLLTA